VYPARSRASWPSPQVADVAVFGIPHPEWGEEIKAVVQPRRVPPGDELTDELLAYARTRLARFQAAGTVDYVTELPATERQSSTSRLRDPTDRRHQG